MHAVARTDNRGRATLILRDVELTIEPSTTNSPVPSCRLLVVCTSANSRPRRLTGNPTAAESAAVGGRTRTSSVRHQTSAVWTTMRTTIDRKRPIFWRQLCFGFLLFERATVTGLAT